MAAVGRTRLFIVRQQSTADYHCRPRAPLASIPIGKKSLPVSRRTQLANWAVGVLRYLRCPALSNLESTTCGSVSSCRLEVQLKTKLLFFQSEFDWFCPWFPIFKSISAIELGRTHWSPHFV